MKYRNISWREIEACVAKVARAVRAARFQPDCVVAVLQGGLVPARLLADFFGAINIYPLRAKAYARLREGGSATPRQEGVRQLARVQIEPFRYSLNHKNVLLVDDVHDSGQTLQEIVRRLKRRKPRTLKTATLYYKRGRGGPPDFYARAAAANIWLVFPWEKNEMLKKTHEPAVRRT
ncbi:MAG: hypothetical protein HYV35_04695 [Lentisphaerae bacterium]|nr:hypothetical protein [Lentisphaerota bacterium]